LGCGAPSVRGLGLSILSAHSANLPIPLVCVRAVGAQVIATPGRLFIAPLDQSQGAAP